MEDYSEVFKEVNGQIVIDTRYSPEQYLEMLSNTRIYNADIINMCGGLLNIFKLPTISIPVERFRGDYIDFLKSSDLNARMTRGIDPYQRPFISFCYSIRRTTANSSSETESNDYRLEVETMFQRYRDNRRIWTTGGNSTEISMGFSRITCDPSDCARITERLLRLIHDKPVGYVLRDVNGDPVESIPRVNDMGLSIVFLESGLQRMPKDLQEDIIRNAIEMRFRPGHSGYSESFESFNSLSS